MADDTYDLLVHGKASDYQVQSSMLPFKRSCFFVSPTRRENVEGLKDPYADNPSKRPRMKIMFTGEENPSMVELKKNLADVTKAVNDLTKTVERSEEKLRKLKAKVERSEEKRRKLKAKVERSEEKRRKLKAKTRSAVLRTEALDRRVMIEYVRFIVMEATSSIWEQGLQNPNQEFNSWAKGFMGVTTVTINNIPLCQVLQVDKLHLSEEFMHLLSQTGGEFKLLSDGHGKVHATTLAAMAQSCLHPSQDEEDKRYGQEYFKRLFEGFFGQDPKDVAASPSKSPAATVQLRVKDQVTIWPCPRTP